MRKKIKSLLIGSNNKGKLKEIRDLLPRYIKTYSASDFKLKSPIENGKNFRENSIIKSMHFSKKSRLICLADDSGLEIDILDKKPGIYSARWGGKNSDFKKAIKIDRIIGFLLVLPSNLNYRSPNYQWFSNHYKNFAYIDRVVISKNYKNNGIGTSLYLDLEKFLCHSKSLIACEFNLKPVNKESKNFHIKLNYEHVGTQFTENNRKQVSLMIKRLHD